MKKWQYWFYLPEGTNTPVTNWNGDAINALGRDGWEAVGFLSTNSLLLKREILDKHPDSGV